MKIQKTRKYQYYYFILILITVNLEKRLKTINMYKLKRNSKFLFKAQYPLGILVYIRSIA